MKTILGDIWEVKADYRGITTNGTVTKAGNAVMGRGVALQAKQKFPGIEYQLGQAIKFGGNRLHLLDLLPFISSIIFSFPVKHNWWEKADLNLIRQSVKELKELADLHLNKTFSIPLPGTGNGGLKPNEVWPLLKELPDNVIVVVYKLEKTEDGTVDLSSFEKRENIGSTI